MLTKRVLQSAIWKLFIRRPCI